MTASDLKAYVDAQEYEGTAAADESTPRPEGLREFAQSVGIDVERYFPFGVDIYLSEPTYMLDRARISILAVEKAVAGNNFKEIDAYANQNGSLPFVRFGTKAKLDEAIKYFRRVRITLLKRDLGPGMYEETESVEL